MRAQNLKLYRVRNPRTYFWIAADDESAAISYATNKVPMSEDTWRAIYAGPRFDRCTRVPGILPEAEVRRVLMPM